MVIKAQNCFESLITGAHYADFRFFVKYFFNQNLGH